MSILDIVKTVVKAIYNFIGKVINTILEKTFLQLLIILWAVSHFHSDFFKYSKFGVFINGTDNITTHDHALFRDVNEKVDPKKGEKK